MQAIIMSEFRTGSTWLGEALGQHTAIQFSHEPYMDAVEDMGLEPRPEKDGERLGTSDFCNYVAGFEAMCPNRYYLWKLQGWQHRELSDPEMMWKQLESRPEIPIVFLWRKNFFHWLISGRVGSIRQVWTRRAGQIIEDVEPFELDVKNAEYRCRMELDRCSFIRERLSDRPRYCEVTYEDLCLDFEGECSRIFEMMGLTSQPVSSTMFKMQKTDPREQITNWDEVREHFSDSVWDKYGFTGV